MNKGLRLTPRQIFALTGTTMALIGMEYGIGRHIYYLPHDDGILATKLDWLCQAFFITALTGGKISVAFLILRISNTKWHTYFLHTINIALLIINLPLIVWTYCQCRPTAALWDPAVKGECQEPKLQGGFAVFQGCMSLRSCYMDSADWQQSFRRCH